MAKHKPSSSKTSGKHNSAKGYQHMAGSPMDQADHPVTQMPAPEAGSMDGVSPPGVPMAPMSAPGAY